MSNRVPLLLVPGLLCDAALWQKQINALKDIANCTVALTTQQDSMEAIAASVLQVAPPRFALAAVSMGGYVAFEIMRQAPERVLKLAILDSSARPDLSDAQARRQLLMNLSKEGQFRGVTPRLLPNLIHLTQLGNKALTDTIMQMAERVGREAFINQQTAIMGRIDSRPFLPHVTCKTLVVGGLQDVTTPLELQREIASLIPGARLEIIDQCGHLPPIEQPEQVNELLRRWIA
jgi:pimeloyl-ACP methyl ester carboxylesterase